MLLAWRRQTNVFACVESDDIQDGGALVKKVYTLANVVTSTPLHVATLPLDIPFEAQVSVLCTAESSACILRGYTFRSPYSDKT